MEMFTYPNCKESIWLAVLFILWIIVTQIIFIVAKVPPALCGVLLYGSTAIALAIGFRTKVMDRSILKFNKIEPKILLLAVGGTLCIPWVHSIFYSMLPYSDHLTKIFIEIEKKGMNDSYIYSIISSILLPFIMEIIFRGIILRGLLAEYKIWKAITISAIIYAVVWGCMTLLPILGLIYGLWFAWLYVYSRNLWTSLLSFIALEFMSIVYCIFSRYFTISPQVESAMTGELWIVNWTMTIVFCILTYFLYQTFRHNGN